jgi:hypothetical protein
MNKIDRLWTLQNASILLGLLIAQVLLFFVLINIDDTGPLGGLIIVEWGAWTSGVIVIHGLLWIFSSRKLLFKTAFLTCILFWIIAWNIYGQWERTFEARETINRSNENLKYVDLIKTNVEKALKERNITYEWLQDSLYFKIYENDSTRYFITGEFTADGRIWVFERITSAPALKDTAVWLKKLTTVIPLLNYEQLLKLNKIVKEKSFCLKAEYQSYSNTYPCHEDFLLQIYDSTKSEFRTLLQFPYLSSK